MTGVQTCALPIFQALGTVSETLGLEPFADKWKSFGWIVREVDGHDHSAIQNSLNELAGMKGGPKILIGHTTKGKGVSFMENSILWHYRTAQGEEFDAALAELEAAQ